MLGSYGIEVPSLSSEKVYLKAAELGIEVQQEITAKGTILVSSRVHPSTPQRKDLDQFLFSLQRVESFPQT